MRPPLERAPAALQTQQAEFAGALFDLQRRPVGLRTAHQTQSLRLDVYRNNVRASLVGCLRSTYPVVRRLVGDNFFDCAAQIFVEHRPPATPVLLKYGDGFGDFLVELEPARGLPYLPDVARLEWHVACASHAADARPIDGAMLGRMPGEEAAHAVLLLHPSLRIIRSAFPVAAIWHANTAGDGTPASNTVDDGGAALIIRPRFKVEVAPIARGMFEFIETLSAGDPLAQAGAVAAQQWPEFDLAAGLVQIFNVGAVTGITSRHPLSLQSKGPPHA